ncbi:hypothetical protein J19TS2_25380 [Cohnella xylanilytica]|uniref:chemotaxis protein CheW n=1 Tax=Cohnella xylanilytica TaxID=557555 RepID=UPI001B2E87F0|nr:chemotaxis protein CheW [Cohnella xylanilytica]GIO12983.1 hypothetical protein J19TS2_25380 [Cohnella xylanilytica]
MSQTAEQAELSEQAEQAEQYVELHAGGERYAIRIEEIGEILRVGPMTAIPGARPSILGVTNIRGSLVPIVCLRRRLGMEEADPETGTEASSSARIVVVPYRGENVGIRVDGVSRVVRMRSVQPAGGARNGPGAADGEGIGRTGEGLAGILKVERILEEQPWQPF